MEFFLPSLIVLILSAIVVFVFLPRMAPFVLLLLSAGLLGFGIYHHYSLFKDEYRFSTWQDQLKIYGPGALIGVIVLFLVGFILSFFGGASMPVPSVPSMPEMPSMPEIPPASEVFNNVTNTVTNTVTNAINRVNNAFNRNGAAGNSNNANRNRLVRNAAAKNIRPSFFEEI
jgi:hypothetical protein